MCKKYMTHVLLILSLVLNIVLLSMMFCQENFKIRPIWYYVEKRIRRIAKKRRPTRPKPPKPIGRPEPVRYAKKAGVRLVAEKNVPPTIPKFVNLYYDNLTKRYVIAAPDPSNIVGTVKPYPPLTNLMPGNLVYADTLFDRSYGPPENKLNIHSEKRQDCYTCPTGWKSIVAGGGLPSGVYPGGLGQVCYNLNLKRSSACPPNSYFLQGVTVPVFRLI